MRMLVDFMRGLFHCEEGQTLTEYALLLFFIAVAVIVAIEALGVSVFDIFQDLADTLAAL